MPSLFWPLSMLGMFFIGIWIAIACCSHGYSRFAPLVAESWSIVVPTFALPAAASPASCPSCTCASAMVLVIGGRKAALALSGVGRSRLLLEPAVPAAVGEVDDQAEGHPDHEPLPGYWSG